MCLLQGHRFDPWSGKILHAAQHGPPPRLKKNQTNRLAWSSLLTVATESRIHWKSLRKVHQLYSNLNKQKPWTENKTNRNFKILTSFWNVCGFLDLPSHVAERTQMCIFESRPGSPSLALHIFIEIHAIPFSALQSTSVSSHPDLLPGSSPWDN